MIDGFIEYLRYNKGYSENTLQAYAKGLHKIAAFAKGVDSSVRWSTLTKEMIDTWVRQECESGAAASSIKLTISALRTFYKTAFAMGAKIGNPARYVATPKRAFKLPNTIPAADLRRAYSAQKDGVTKAILAILFETGIRLQEMIDIRPEDIDTTNKRIKIHGKGNKERFVYYGAETEEHLEELVLDDMSQRDIRQRVYNALKPYTDAKQVSPHAIRHTAACEMLNNGMQIETVSKLLGHQSVQTTEIYAQISNGTATRQYSQAGPRL